MTRKIIAIFAALLLSVSLVACNDEEKTEETTTGTKIEVPTTEGETTAKKTETEETEGKTEAKTEEETENNLVFNPINGTQAVYVLHKNKAVILHNSPSYSDGSTLSVANGTQLERVEISDNGEWSKVKYEGESYYVASQALTTLADLDAGFVKVDKTYKVVANVNVRIAPEVTELAGEVTQYNVIGSLAKDDTIKVIAENTETGWLKIEFASEYEGAVYVRYNEAWYEGDEVATEATTQATTEAATETVTETEAAQ